MGITYAWARSHVHRNYVFTTLHVFQCGVCPHNAAGSKVCNPQAYRSIAQYQSVIWLRLGIGEKRVPGVQVRKTGHAESRISRYTTYCI